MPQADENSLTYHRNHLGHQVDTFTLKVPEYGPQGTLYARFEWKACSCGKKEYGVVTHTYD